MSIWQRLKISQKITLSIVAIALALIALLSYSSIRFIKDMGTSSLKDKGSSLGIITAETIKPAVQYGVSDDAEKVLNQLISHDSDVSVAAIVIQNPKGDFAVTNQKTSKQLAGINLAKPLKELGAHAPAKKNEVAMLGGTNLKFLAVKIDLTSNDTIQNGYLLLALNDTRISHVINTSTATMLGLGVVMLLIGGPFAFFISRAITKPLNEAVRVANALATGDLRIDVVVKSRDEIGELMVAMQHMVGNLREMISKTVQISSVIASSSNELQRTSAQIATGAERVASQTDEVATASEEMAATSSEIACNCGLAAVASGNSTDAANAGARIVQETTAGMSIIAERVQQTSKTIEALGARSEQIGDIVGTIEDIADQTNLLALNAAIEAARAGEQGRGFAVVADEVRALAERTTKATREIGGMIKAIQNETGAAVKAMDEGVREVEKGTLSSMKSGQALIDILSRINEVATQINQIATAAEEQTATTNEVTTKVQQITDIVAQTATGAGSTADAAAQLAQQAQDLQKLVSGFRLP
jgi:methyl-accepting chemotaxis protein